MSYLLNVCIEVIITIEIKEMHLTWPVATLLNLNQTESEVVPGTRLYISITASF